MRRRVYRTGRSTATGSSSRVTALVFVLWLGLIVVSGTGCDSTPGPGDDIERPGSADALYRRGDVPDTTMYMSTSVLHLSLAGSFAFTSGRPVVYHAVADAPIAVLTVWKTDLQINPLAFGSTTISVKAGDENEVVDSLEFSLTILDDCPAAVEWGIVDYFPLDIGRTATFDFEFGNRSYFEERESGISEWEVVGRSCLRGTAEITIRESRNGLRTVMLDTRREYPLSETIDRTVTLTDSLLSVSSYTRESIPRVVLSSPDTLRILQGSFPDERVELHFARQEGLQFWSYHSSDLFMGASSWGRLRRRNN